MCVALVTGSAGLVGSAACQMFSEQGFDVVGIDNDYRQIFFGASASTFAARIELEKTVRGYTHRSIDIRDANAMDGVFREYGADLRVIIHTAAQPSHDWAASDPSTDFAVNAVATASLLDLARHRSPGSTFIYMSTNKVYGDTPNRLPFEEQPTRWEIPADHRFHVHGIDETMSIDQTLHSLFGASKLAADVLVQEYGRYFGLPTVCFRAGCITGPKHAGAQAHGFLSYLVRCSVEQTPYTIFGYGGKQVRDILHANDLASMFWHYHLEPRPGAVYNVGGGRRTNCSVLEAIALCDELSGHPLAVNYVDQARIGDHIWWISDTRQFERDYPSWRPQHNLTSILAEMHASLTTGS